jgi:DNA-binding MarR family transcriptional regulator
MNDKAHPAPKPGTLETAAMADQIRGLCSVITKVARADLEARLQDHGSGISAIEHGVLRHLSHGVTSMAEISRLMGVAPSTLVYVVDGLTRKKLVKRCKDPRDRRREPLRLEKKGVELFARFPKMDASSILVMSLERMTESRRRELLTLLNELVEDLTGSGRHYLDTEPEEAKASPSRGRKAASTPKPRR